MSDRIQVAVDSEIGDLEAVLLHRPGPEIENMTPQNAERALYSDILNLPEAAAEYAVLEGVLARCVRVLHVDELLADVLADETARAALLRRICAREGVDRLEGALAALPAAELARRLVEGIALAPASLTEHLSDERHALRPLHNLFFMRDAAAVIGDRVLVGRMASAVREREAVILEAVLRCHPALRARTVEPAPPVGAALKLEGGDVLVAREDLLIFGLGQRTSPQAVDFVVERLRETRGRFDVVVQELPAAPESFIHLDMVFTILDRDACLVYEPVITGPSRLRTVHLRVEGGRVVSIREDEHLLDCLRRLGLDLEPVACGGHTDPWLQEREQWHSGTNSFALAPGRVIVYARNVHTVEELDRHGFAVVEARDVAEGRVDPAGYRRCAIVLPGSELPRGGGGPRCMTMPLRRAPIS